MYTKILAQGTKFGSGTTGLDNPVVGVLFLKKKWLTRKNYKNSFIEIYTYT